MDRDLITSLSFPNKSDLYKILNLFFLDLAFLEFNLSLLLQHGQRCTGNKLMSTNIPQIEHGLCPATNLYPPVGRFAAYL